MAEELDRVEIRDDFYRDSFNKAVIALVLFFLALLILLALSLYIYLSKPPPVTFVVDSDFRVQAPVPVNLPYLSVPDVLQWTSNAVQKFFVYDFLHYNAQLKSAAQYFTDDGWKAFQGQLNTYANVKDIQSNKQFINATISGAPFILNQSTGPSNLLSGRWAWWVQVPMTLNYFSSYNRSYSQNLTLQILVVRVSTLNNLNGIGIDNVIVLKNGVNPT